MKKLCLILTICGLVLAFPAPGNCGEKKSTALEASNVISSGATRLYRIDGYNGSASGQWYLIMNASSLPSNGAVTLLYPPIYVDSHRNFSLLFNQGLAASTGVVVANSSTGTFSLTIGSADSAFYAIFQ